MQKKNSLLCALSALGMFLCATLSAQEALLSSTEQYYDFLALDGYSERPYLNYRTLSDSKWAILDESGNVWGGNNLGTARKLGDAVSFRVYGPEAFASYNSAAPYGQNDGALWQGRGLNSSLTAGARLEAYGFELTLKPEVVYSQNLAFNLVKPAYSGEVYAAKADTYGYYGVTSIDALQRFGDSSIYAFSWGDSEIRYSWKTLTVGFGTQSVWLGPAKVNSIMLSNNASPFPKADIGIRKTAIRFGSWYAGDVEMRLFCGFLSESGYFDTVSDNDHNLLSGLSAAISPSLFPDLTVFANRSYLSKWNDKSSIKTVPSLFFVNLGGNGGTDVWDQRASFGFDYHVPRGGIEVYGEAGINDYGVSAVGYIRYPFHSMVYTGGVRKTVALEQLPQLRGELTFECTTLEISQDFQFQWASTFYAHYQITQGYTNEGQWLGAGNGTGGNSQYLGFKVYHKRGNVNIFMHRSNPDNDYIYAQSVKTVATEDVMVSIRAILSAGCVAEYFLTKNMILHAGFIYSVDHNPQYNPISWDETSKRNNYRIESSLAYRF